MSIFFLAAAEPLKGDLQERGVVIAPLIVDEWGSVNFYDSGTARAAPVEDDTNRFIISVSSILWVCSGGGRPAARGVGRGAGVPTAGEASGPGRGLESR